MYISTVQSNPLLILHSLPTLVFKPLIPRRPIQYLFPLPLYHHPLLLAVLLCLLPPPPLTLGVLQWNAGGLQLPSPPLGLEKYSRPCREEVFDWVIFSYLLPLNHPDTTTLLHHSSHSRSSPDISFASSSLALFCSWEVLQDLGFNYLPILLSVPLNKRPPSFNFQKACWDDFASYFDSHCPSAWEYSSLLFFLLLLSFPLWH